ncbi:branched-chain amino acid ABC transporter permease [Candidatus Aerophobetes bacterium]|nr:branched-chain amino acid ABC transporter permease [Candidatus Aerophobetes bacterium]
MSLLFQETLNGVMVGSIYALIAIGLTVIFGVMDISNFAHGEFLMLGAYVSYLLSTIYQLSFFVSLCLAGLTVGLIGIVLEKLCFHPLMGRSSVGTDTIMLTIGLCMLVENLVQAIWTPTPRMLPDPFKGISIMMPLGVSIGFLRVISFVIAISILVAFQLFLTRNKMGIAINATAQNKKAALLMGVNINKIYSLAFFMSAFTAGVGGTLYSTIYALFPTMGATPTLKAFVITILGGMGSIRGAIFGGFILGITEALGGTYIASGYKDAFGFIILILILLLRPSGLFGRK